MKNKKKVVISFILLASMMIAPIGGSIQNYLYKKSSIMANEVPIRLKKLTNDLKQYEEADFELNFNANEIQEVSITASPLIQWDIEQIKEINSQIEFSLLNDKLSIKVIQTEDFDGGMNQVIIKLRGVIEQSGEKEIVIESNGEKNKFPIKVEEAKHDLKVNFESTINNITTENIQNTNVNDILQYTTVISTEEQLKQGMLEFTLPKEVKFREDLILEYNNEGFSSDVHSSTLDEHGVYDPKTNKVKVQIENIHNNSIAIKFRVMVSEESSGLELLSKITLNGLDKNHNQIEEMSTEKKIMVNKYHEKSSVIISYLNEDGESIAENQIIEGIIGDSYSKDIIEFNDYDLIHTEGDITGIFDSSIQNITFTYKKRNFELNQEVIKTDGTTAINVDGTEKLNYQVILSEPISNKNQNNYYKKIVINAPLDRELKAPTNLQMINENNQLVGKVSYNPDTHTIIGTISENEKINQAENISLKYETELKDYTTGDFIVKTQATAEVETEVSVNNENINSNATITRQQVSNEILLKATSGSLSFVSAPEFIDYGSLNSAPIKNEDYTITDREGNLIIKDTRTSKKIWSVSMKMSQVLTNQNGNTLPEVMHYRINGKDSLISESVSTVIHNQIPNPTGEETSVNLSENWGSTNGPVIKLTGSQVKPGLYDGKILWNLQDVPGQE